MLRASKQACIAEMRWGNVLWMTDGIGRGDCHKQIIQYETRCTRIIIYELEAENCSLLWLTKTKLLQCVTLQSCNTLRDWMIARHVTCIIVNYPNQAGTFFYIFSKDPRHWLTAVLFSIDSFCVVFPASLLISSSIGERLVIYVKLLYFNFLELW